MKGEVSVLCQNVNKVFKSGETVTHALRQINLEIYRGELFMLVGPSGCGKTTLISVIAGVLTQDSGTITVSGENFKEMGEDARAEFRGKKVGFVFQAFNLIPQLTAAENVAIPLLLQDLPFNQATAAAAEVLRDVGLASKITALPTQLSGGQQQRVAIARALVHKPEIIVCDEPTSALDHQTGIDVMELLKLQAKQQNATLIIVTHDQRVFSYADRMAVMEDGEIKRLTTPKELH